MYKLHCLERKKADEPETTGSEKTITQVSGPCDKLLRSAT